MIVNCPYCDTPHESINSAAQHAWKTQDGHPVRDLDDAILAVVGAIDRADVPEEYRNPGEDSSVNGSPDDSVEQPPTTPDGESTTVDGGNSPGGDGTAPNGSQPVRTDGAQEVPSFDSGDPPELEDGADGCPNCGSEGEPVDVLRGRDGVSEDVVEALAAEGSRWCPDCSTAETAEVW